MPDLLPPVVQAHYAALINHPAYHQLYGMYADYLVNNTFFIPRENKALLQRLLRQVQPILWNFKPYRKSETLRLFTERQSLERFSPDMVNEAWREVRAMIDKVGPPAGWKGGQAGAAASTDKAGDNPPSNEWEELADEGEDKPAVDVEPPFPKSPINYDQEA